MYSNACGAPEFTASFASELGYSAFFDRADELPKRLSSKNLDHLERFVMDPGARPTRFTGLDAGGRYVVEHQFIRQLLESHVACRDHLPRFVPWLLRYALCGVMNVSSDPGDVDVLLAYTLL
jgi:hypothetical protein